MTEQQQLPCPKCGRTWWWTKNTKPDEAICPPWYGCNPAPKTTTIDREPYTITIDGDDLFIFTPEHTFKDIAQWIFNKGGAKYVMYYLAELAGGQKNE